MRIASQIKSTLKNLKKCKKKVRNQPYLATQPNAVNQFTLNFINQTPKPNL